MNFFLICLLSNLGGIRATLEIPITTPPVQSVSQSNPSNATTGGTATLAFSDKIATLDRAIVDLIVDPRLDAMLGEKQLTDPYPHAIFEQCEHVRGFASVLCNPDRVHHDHMGSDNKDIVAPATAFYFRASLHHWSYSDCKSEMFSPSNQVVCGSYPSCRYQPMDKFHFP